MCDISQDILDKLKCSLCDGYLSYSPIFTTDSGSNICGRCPVPIDAAAVRSVPFEELAKEILFPCTNHRNGCEMKFTFDAGKDHEKYCEFNAITCPIDTTGNCAWVGCCLKLYEHCKRDHPKSFYENSEQLYYNIRNNNEKNMLLMAYGTLFLVQIKVSVVTGKLWHCVRYLGNALLTAQYKFRVIISADMSKIEDSKQVAPHSRMLIEQCCSIESNINSLLSLFKHFDNIKFEIKVDKHLDLELLEKFVCKKCGKYAKERVFKSALGCVCNSCQYDDERDECLSGMSPQVLYPCQFANKGCAYFELMKDIEKHENYFCDYSQCLLCCQYPLGNKLVHYEKKHSSVICKNNKFSRKKVTCQSPDYAIIKYNNIYFVCGWGMENCNFIIFIYSNVSFESLYIYSCKITLSNSKTGEKYKNYGIFQHNTSYDYMLQLDVKEMKPYLSNNKLNICIEIIKKDM